MGVRFHPGAAGAFLSVPLPTLVDPHVALESIWTGAEGTTQQVAEAAGPASPWTPSRAIACAAGASSDPFATPRALIERLAASARVHLRFRPGRRRRDHPPAPPPPVRAARRVRPKKLGRILRLRRALRLIETRGGTSLATVALDAGYYDQAHMNADFRDLAGRPPLGLAD